MRVIFAGGGTAGHINPALAIAKQIEKDYPGSEVLFIGTEKGMESTLVPKAGFNIRFISVSGFVTKPTLKNFKIAAKAVKAIADAKKIIREFKADVVIGTGGYVSGPVLYAAHLCKLPTLIHEQNVIPGMTTKMLNNFADITAVSFPQSRQHLKNAKRLVLTGNPIRSEIFSEAYEHARDVLALDERPFVVIMGGSLGAEAVNNAAVALIKNNKGRAQIMLSTGKSDYDRVADILKKASVDLENTKDVRVVPYIHNSEVVLPAADLVVARTGAITVSEITALGKPSVLIPSPNVAHNHQEYNARAMQSAGAAIMILEPNLTDKKIVSTVFSLLDNRAKMEEMAVRSYQAGIRNGTDKLSELAGGLAGQKRAGGTAAEVMVKLTHMPIFA